MAINKKLITFDKKLTFLGANGINNLSSPVNGYYNLIPTWSMVFIKDTGEIWHDGVYFGKPIKDQIAPIMSGTTKGLVFTPNGTDYYYKTFNLWGNTFDGDTININGDLVVQGVTYKWTYGDASIKKGNTNLIAFSNNANNYDVFIPNGNLNVTGGDIDINNNKIKLSSTGSIKGTHILNTNSYFNADNTLGKTWNSIKLFNTSGTTISLDTTRPAIINILEHAHASNTLWVPWIAGGDITEQSSWGIGLGGDAFYIGRIAKAHTENSLSQYWKFDSEDGITISGTTKYIKVADLSGASEKIFMADGTVKALSDLASETLIGEATTTNYGGFKLTQDKASSQQSLVANTTGNGRYAVKMNANGTLYVEFSQANTWLPATNSQAGYVPQLSGNGTITTQSTEYVLTYVSSGSGTVTPTWKLLPANAFKNDNTWKPANSSQEGYVPKSTASKILRSDANGALYWGDDSNTWKEVTTSLEGYVPKIVTTGSLAATDSPFILVYKNVSGSTKTAWVPLPANAFNNTWTAANFTNAGYVPKSVKGKFLHAKSDTGALEWVDDNNTWDAASTSKAGYVPKLATGGGTIASSDTAYVLAYKSGVNGTTAPTWMLLPSNAYDNTWTAMVGATSSANGTVGYVNAVPPKNGYNTKFLRADGTWSIPAYPTKASWNYDDVYTKKAQAIPIIVGPSTDTTAGTWTGTTDAFSSYVDGLTIIYVPAVAGAATTTLNINGLGAKTCYYTNTSKLTTHFAVGTPIMFTYYGGYWKRADYDSNTQYYLTLNGVVKGNSGKTDLGTIWAPSTLASTGGYILATNAAKTGLEWVAKPATNVTTTAVVAAAADGTTQISAALANPYYNLLEGGAVTRSIQFTSSNITISSTTGGVISFTAKNWTGATSSAAGTAGYMPGATSANRLKYLRGDGSWVVLSLADHTHSVKINGSTKTIAASGGTAVDLGSYLPLTGGTITGAVVIKKDLGGNLSEWILVQHGGPFEVGRNSNTMRVTIGVTDDDYGFIQCKGLNITSSGKLVLLPGGGNLYFSKELCLIAHAGNISNKSATIGSSLTTIATIAGVNITAKIGSYASSSHTHKVKINGTEKTIAAPGGEAVNLGNYVPKIAGTGSVVAHKTSVKNWKGCKILIPGGYNAWMIAFTVRIYVNYQYTDIVFSGYHYSGDHWWSPEARVIGGTKNYKVVMGYEGDSANSLYVWIGNADNTVLGYGGITIMNLHAGHRDDPDWYTTWTISDVDYANLTNKLYDTTTVLPAMSNHTHPLSIATDSGTNQLTLAASTKYKLTTGGSTFIFTTPPNTWNANAVGVAGYVAAPTKAANANMVWKTDSEGNPAWRKDANDNTEYYLTLNGTVKGTSGKTDLGTIYAPISSGTGFLKCSVSGSTVTWSYDNTDYLPLSAGSGKALTGNLYFNSSGKGIYFKDSAGNNYAAIYENGTNLWIGSNQLNNSTHHTGSTYISAGSGDVYISRLVNNTRASYKVLDAGNTYVSGGKGYINSTEITTITGNAGTATHMAYTGLTGSGTTANQAILSNGTTNGWKLATVSLDGHTHSYITSAGFSSSGFTSLSTWGTLKTANSYTGILNINETNGGSWEIAAKSGLISMLIDGYYYLNEGLYRVLDTSDISNYYNKTDSDSRYVNITGDTMSDSLSIKGRHDIQSSTNGIASTNYIGYYIKDVNDLRSAQYINTVSANGNNAFWISVTYGLNASGNEVDRGFGLTVDKQGNCTWNISGPEAFRTAIGINLNNLVTVNTVQTISAAKQFNGGITPIDSGNVTTASIGNKFWIKKAVASTDGTPNNGLVLEYGGSSTWTGQLYMADNGRDGLYWGGWYEGVRQEWLKIAFASDLSNYLPLSGGTMTGLIKTSFKLAVATGSYAPSAVTIPNLIDDVRYSSGVMGSVNITTAYTLSGVTIPTRWYNYLWIPHRTGGVNGTNPSGDNVNYGSLLLSGITGSGMYVVRYNNGISEVHDLYSVSSLATSRNIWGQSFNGTANVDGQLTVHYATDSTNWASDNGGIRIMNTTGSNPYILGLAVNGSFAEILSSQMGVGEKPLIINKKGGNVGIGNSSPAYKLDVSGTGRFSGDLLMEIGKYIKFKIGSGYTSALGVWGTGYNLLQLGYYTTSEKSYATNIYGNTLRLYGSASALGMLINTSGNVGVGTDSPGYKLDVNGVLRANYYKASWSASGTGGSSGYVNIANITVTGSWANAPLKFRVVQRGQTNGGEITVRFTNADGAANAAIAQFFCYGDILTAFITRSGTVFSLYIEKAEPWDTICITGIDFGPCALSVEWKNGFATSIPSGAIIAEHFFLIGNNRIIYDSANSALKVAHKNGSSTANFYASNFYTTSDRNKKLNITVFSEHIRKFQLKGTEKYAYGVIAQEVEEMFRSGKEGEMNVNYNSILSFYVGQLENRVKELEEKIRLLETK